MKKVLGSFVCLFVILSCELHTEHDVLLGNYYVAPGGDDRAEGTLTTPWKTIERALEQLAAGSERPEGGVTIWVRGGTYFVEQTILLNSEHSGTPDNPILIKAFPGEQPVFVGGREIGGWSLDVGQVYKARLDKVESGDWRFEQLFENGVRQTEARYPNEGYLRSGEPTDQLYTQFTFQQDQLPNWSDSQGAQVSIWAYANWFENIVPIADIDYETRVITLAGAMQQINKDKDRYFIQGIREELDVAGEFYLDESTGDLYYWPQTTPIEEQQIIAPTVVNVFEFKGDSADKRVEYITLEGLTIWGSQFTDFYGHGGSIPGPSKSVNRPGEEHREGLIQLVNASNITILNSTIYNAGYNCINMGYHASNNTVSGNSISDCGLHGVLMVGKDAGEGVINDPSEQIYDNKFNTIRNNHIHRSGALAGDSGGVYLYQSGDNDIAHNYVHDMPRYGIAMKGHAWLNRDYKDGFGNVEITPWNYWDFYTAKNNVVRFNHIHDVLKDSYDAGAITFRKSGLYNVIDNNRIHEVNPPANMDRLFPFGIYLDGGTTETTITNNVIYDIGTANHGYAIKMKKLRNTVINNILILEPGRNGVLAMQRGGAPQPVKLGFGQHVVKHNILYAKGDDPVIYWFKSEDEFSCDLVSVSEDNLFYLPDSTTARFYLQSDFKHYSLDNWKSLCDNKYDQRTIIGDPLFVDEANDDYRLQPGSPAYEIGFKDIDQHLAGLEDSYMLVDELVAVPGQLSGEINLSWNAVKAADAYQVWRSTSYEGEYQEVGITEAANFTDTVLVTGTRYYYKINALIGTTKAPMSRETSAIPANPGAAQMGFQ